MPEAAHNSLVLLETLSDDHAQAKKAFHSGVDPLDRYLKQQAGQDLRNKVSVTYVLLEENRGTILGYYTLSAMAVALCDLPAEITAKLPKYPVLPATLIGRLAVDTGHRKRGWGEYLLMDALHRSLENSKVVGSMAVVVDARDASARAFYLRYDFVQFPDQPNRLFLQMSKIAKLFP